MKKPNNQVKSPDQAQLMLNWEKAVAENNTSLASTHIKKQFTFSASELRQMIKLYTIETIAKQAIDDKLNNDVLPRMSITPSPQVKILYDLSVGRFCVWTPKNPPSPVEDKVKN